MAGAALVALAAASPASVASTVVHSATSGELTGGRLVLHGVRGKVTWTHHDGDSGLMSIRRLHRRGFAARQPAATGVLHVAGHRGGDELIFKLSKPRYNRARRTVSYRAKPLDNKPLPRQLEPAVGTGQPRRFGAASLSIVFAPSYQHCRGKFSNLLKFPLIAKSSTWPDNTWESDPGPGVDSQQAATWETRSAFMRSCGNRVTWTSLGVWSDPLPDEPVTVVIETEVGMGGRPWTSTCDVTVGSHRYTCVREGDTGSGYSNFSLVAAY